MLYLAVSTKAQPIFDVDGLRWFTNSMFVAILVAVGLTLFVRWAARKISLVPNEKQNMVEGIIGLLYDQIEELLGKKLAPRAFALLGTIFVFILAANYSGLIPGVGTIGFGYNKEGHGFYVTDPFIRPPTADLNMNLAMAVMFMVMWLIWSIQEVGAKGFLGHMFAPKGNFKGATWVAMAAIFFVVGLIEVVSIAFRPVSLSVRLYGNIYAGETLLHTMSTIGTTMGLTGPLEIIVNFLGPIPFYFLELLIGLLQAGIFMMLCTVYLMLSTGHEEDDH